MAKPKYEVGQKVIVLDTANNREREGTVDAVDGKKVFVKVHRFGNVLEFQKGETNLGRFKLADQPRMTAN